MQQCGGRPVRTSKPRLGGEAWRCCCVCDGAGSFSGMKMPLGHSSDCNDVVQWVPVQAGGDVHKLRHARPRLRTAARSSTGLC